MTTWPRRVGTLGAGALGCLFAYQFTRHTAAEVWLLARTLGPADIEVEGDGRVAVRVTSRPSVPVDLLLVLVKAYATADALTWAAGAIGLDTVVLTLQNGLGNAEAIAEVVGAGRVLVGTTAQGATLLGPGRVRHAGAGPTQIAPWEAGGKAAARAAAVAAYLRQGNVMTEVVSDPQPLLWGKLVANCGINALTAILRVPNGDLLTQPDARRIMENAAREAAAVAKAYGVVLGADPVEQTIAVAQATAANRSSMLQDVEQRRRTEVDAMNGAVAERGRIRGVPAPVNETLAGLVRSL